ncbi:MAG: glycosyltransferase [Bacteroidales bacterium]|nr:glycosyltransferase [Bacteroidales bacterium]
MEKPLISVIVPVYNMEAYLAECLDSILKSGYSPFELIIMDDGSTDRSLQIAREYAANHPNIRVQTQANAGVSAARNAAIEMAQGEYILPVDADDLIYRDYLEKAVEVLLKQDSVKAVTARAEFFGDKTGEWLLPNYSPSLLARKNILSVCAMFRKRDWAACGGYCTYIPGREDWDFWISMLKNGGEVVRLNLTGFYYRYRKSSRRVTDRKKKRQVIDILNKRHADFFERELKGKLHYNRTYSKFFNSITNLLESKKIVLHKDYNKLYPFISSLHEQFETTGDLMFQARNTIKSYLVQDLDVVVKSYGNPLFINRIIYGNIRASKAKRAYKYALKLRSYGINTPQPLAYIEIKKGLILYKSYFISLKSTFHNHLYDLCAETPAKEVDKLVRGIAVFTAKLHDLGILHKDYSSGNLLYEINKHEVLLQVIDLNRMRFGRVGLKKGCKNFERLCLNEEILSRIAEEYSEARSFDKALCVAEVLNHNRKHRSRRSKKQGQGQSTSNL